MGLTKDQLLIMLLQLNFFFTISQFWLEIRQVWSISEFSIFSDCGHFTHRTIHAKIGSNSLNSLREDDLFTDFVHNLCLPSNSILGKRVNLTRKPGIPVKELLNTVIMGVNSAFK